jgi:hypothetical protein
MRVVAALLAFLFAVAPVAAQDDLDRRIEQARIFVDLTTADSVMGPMVDAVWPSVEMQLPGDIPLEVAERLKGTFADEIKAALGDVLDDFTAAYANVFTLEELVAINKFYASDAGLKLVANQGALMQEMLPTITARLTATMPAAMENVIREAEEEGLLKN